MEYPLTVIQDPARLADYLSADALEHLLNVLISIRTG